MSFKAFVWAWDQDVPNGDYQHVLLAVADIAPVREAKASVIYIARKVRRSPHKVRAALEWLEGAGLITITERPGRTDIIRLAIPSDFRVLMDDDGDLEAGVRGRPGKPLHPAKTPAPLDGKPLLNACTQGAGEPKEPQKEEPKEATDVALPPPPSEARQAFNACRAMILDLNERNPELKRSVPGELTESRRRAIKARIKEAGGLDGWMEAMDRASRSPFLSGCVRGQHGVFSISLDFLLQPSSFTKLREGFYDGKRHDGSEPTSGDRDARHADRNASLVAGALAAVDRSSRQ